LRQSFAVGLAVALALSACQHAPKAPVTDAIVSLPAVAGRPGAAYFTLNGGEKNARVMEIHSPAAMRVELHESRMRDGKMSMAAMEGGVEVPARGTVKFTHGGKHAMMFDMKPGINAGDTVKLSFYFADGKTVNVDAIAHSPGDANLGHAH
jgi:periplasmic copper chaperone A